MPRLPILVPAAALSLACSPHSRFTTNFAPGFVSAHHTVSVFGVYKDGQMSAEAWDSLAPRLSSWLGPGVCRAGYGAESATAANQPIWTAIDDYTRSDGPTDDLISRVAPAARGDLVLVLTVAGKVPEEKKTKVQDETPYSGTSADEAFAQFAAKLHDSLPGIACAGWNWEGTVDADVVRRLGD